MSVKQRAPSSSETAELQAAIMPAGSLAERYARMAHEGFERRAVDPALRALDVAIAGTLLVLSSPIMGVAALAIYADSGKPALYRGRRVGRAGRIFTMYKFRTLHLDAESRLGPYLGPQLTDMTNAEVTRVGKWLRRTHVDELPQLWNVVCGDMSLVGPRPIRPRFFEELCEQIPQYWQRLVVRPGMTGLAQIRIEREMTWSEKLAHDFEFIADRSVGLYLAVIAETIARVVRRIAGGGPG